MKFHKKQQRVHLRTLSGITNTVIFLLFHVVERTDKHKKGTKCKFSPLYTPLASSLWRWRGRNWKILFFLRPPSNQLLFLFIRIQKHEKNENFGWGGMCEGFVSCMVQWFFGLTYGERFRDCPWNNWQQNSSFQCNSTSHHSRTIPTVSVPKRHQPDGNLPLK